MDDATTEDLDLDALGALCATIERDRPFSRAALDAADALLDVAPALVAEVRRLRADLAATPDAVAGIEADNAALRARVAALEGELPPPDGYDALAAENRRLRAILDGVARAGLGTGALVEITAPRPAGTVRLVVCRADRDELAFARAVMGGLEAVARALGQTITGGRREGVTAADGAGDEEPPR